MADLREQKRITAELQKQKEILEAHNKESQAYKKATQEINRLNVERVRVEGEIADAKKRASKEADTISLEKQILRLKNTGLGAANKELGLEKQISGLKIAQSKNNKEIVRQSQSYARLLQGISDGSMDLEAVLRTIAEEDFGMMNEAAEQLAETLRNSPNLTQKLKIEAQAQQKINDFRDKISETSALLSSKKAMGVAAIGVAVKLMTDFANKALEVRQSLGTSAVDSARLAGNLTLAGTAAKAVGGNSQEAEAAVMSLVDEFGSLSVVSAGVSTQLGLITGQFGLSGANAGKLLKQMEAINGASIETNLSLISSVGELARAEGVAPAKVLNDIAGDTETFAKFARDGGKNIAAAAIQAAKLGLNMATVAGIAENLLDFESSIEKQMEASVLLGRQLNLDKARELSLMGDLEGLQKEVLRQVGSEAEFNAMNVVQRKAMADAIGVSVADLGKMVAGEKTSAQAAADKVKAQEKSLQLEKYLAFVTAGGAVAQIFASLAKIPFGLGLLAAGGAAMGMYGMMRSAPKLQTGGVVRESGMAVVHRGETVSGTAGQFGGESNKLLKELISQNASLMGKLTNKVGDLALSS